MERAVTANVRIDAATPAEAEVVLDAFGAAEGVTLIRSHAFRPKREDSGVYWHAMVTVLTSENREEFD